MSRRVAVGVVGLGTWGMELVRAMDDLAETELRWLCDLRIDGKRRLAAAARYPGVRATSDFDDLLNDEFLDAVVIATPVATRYALALRALLADKHALVRDPVASTGDDADELVRVAQRRACRLMVGQPLLFHPAVRKLRELTELGQLGRIHYLYGTWREAGDSPGVESGELLRPADVAVVLYLLDEDPLQVWARGDTHRELGTVDIVHCRLAFPQGLGAYLQVCRLDARRDREFAVVGSKATAVLDQRGPYHRLTIFQADGDVVNPRVPDEDPFRLTSDHFLSMVRSQGSAAVGAREGATVVHVLEALRRSLAENGTAEVPRRSGAGAQVLRLPTQRFA